VRRSRLTSVYFFFPPFMAPSFPRIGSPVSDASPQRQAYFFFPPFMASSSRLNRIASVHIRRVRSVGRHRCLANLSGNEKALSTTGRESCAAGAGRLLGGSSLSGTAVFRLGISFRLGTLRAAEECGCPCARTEKAPRPEVGELAKADTPSPGFIALLRPFRYVLCVSDGSTSGPQSQGIAK